MIEDFEKGDLIDLNPVVPETWSIEDEMIIDKDLFKYKNDYSDYSDYGSSFDYDWN